MAEYNTADAAESIQEGASDSPDHLNVELSVHTALSFEATRTPAGLQSGKDFTDYSIRLLHIAVLKPLGEITDPKFAHRGTSILQKHTIRHAKHSLLRLRLQIIRFRERRHLPNRSRL